MFTTNVDGGTIAPRTEHCHQPRRYDMHIAKTIQAIATLENPLASIIMNRDIPLTESFCMNVMLQTQMSYHGRNPKPSVLKNGTIRKTNLDLLSVLADLYKRSARIEITAYDNQLPWQVTAGEQHVGGTKRYGNITGLISHREHLSFSVQMKDESVLLSSGDNPASGAYRTYMLADYKGQWSQGWHGFTWDMSESEKVYLTRRKILVDGNVDYEDYVHQNRRQSVMGAPYLLLKLLWQRIEDEILFFQKEIKRLECMGVECPSDLLSVPRHTVAEGESQSIEVPVFTMQLHGLKYSGEYTPVTNDALGYRLAYKTISYLSYKLRPMVQFVMRADEVAFYRFGLEQNFVSNWIKGATWEQSSSWYTSLALGETLTLSYRKEMVEKKVAA